MNQNATKALEQMQLEIANEFDANLTISEKSDGAVTRDLVTRAENQLADKDTFNPS
ncbi:small, acid-soluble spore protein, alpha/beta type [Tissierella sp.]|uniref:small, acid-soluble spore protein, alpha/beta type n=1 Tax=Tissierella sp. TaxID=41274 RepID=UPI00286197A2|nr:small, acid-soluble spore protein, alpha/beta type [Tissierella sp.]MDR7855462.1 hypothetical protein [Tissierella sp.]